MNTNETNYTPGVCNINISEIQKRRRIGYYGLLATIILVSILFISDAHNLYRVIIFMPVFIATTGFLQAKNKFCVGYAAAGMHHTEDEAVKTVEDEARKLDKKRAQTMNLQVFGISILVTAVVVLLPV